MFSQNLATTWLKLDGFFFCFFFLHPLQNSTAASWQHFNICYLWGHIWLLQRQNNDMMSNLFQPFIKAPLRVYCNWPISFSHLLYETLRWTKSLPFGPRSAENRAEHGAICRVKSFLINLKFRFSSKCQWLDYTGQNLPFLLNSLIQMIVFFFCCCSAARSHRRTWVFRTG